MPNSDQPRRAIRRVPPKVRKNKRGNARTWNKLVSLMLYGGLIVIGTVVLTAKVNALKQEFAPAVPSGTTQDEASKTKAPRLNPYIPVYGI
jgi:hypothetical protein